MYAQAHSHQGDGKLCLSSGIAILGVDEWAEGPIKAA